MSTAKEQIKQILDNQPEDSSYDELLREIAFKRMVDKGLEDSEQERTISNKDMESRIKQWQQ
ncbi:hypothetical protein MNBD_GAMMA21-1114 [hydrothermal vent metagenome]|uniref:Uncharacterized protein n=1 Tax=hydrothermal vent metagenome TaxID=652676 RepID=A0A3B1AH26_9ZZZZ